jgi:hypothetical protein
MKKRPGAGLLWAVYMAAMTLCLILLVRQYGGWNFPSALERYRQQVAQLTPGTGEPAIRSHFQRVQSINRNYTIGIVAVTDHRPVFGGETYRVYDIGYFDLDKQPRYLMHVVCQNGRIQRVEPAEQRKQGSRGVFTS